MLEPGLSDIASSRTTLVLLSQNITISNFVVAWFLFCSSIGSLEKWNPMPGSL